MKAPPKEESQRSLANFTPPMPASFNNDTIAALSTPPGVSAIGVIRLSGDNAIGICGQVFRGKKLAEQPSHTLHHGWIADGESKIDEVVVALFRSPHSYTGEDVVEISCHGSPYILQKVIDLLVENGARLAKPGEFTLRAFLNGKLDLSQAEAVADLIASDSEASHKAAMRQMRGGFSKELKALRQQLIDFAAMVELELDFSEEDVEFANRKQLKELVLNLISKISQLIESFRLGNVIKHGVNVVIAGRPNAGKSTLLNRLLNEDRAIVSEIPGTTRDTIEEALNINGVLFRLIDTAGIREANDEIERLGIDKTFEKIRQSGILVYLFDVAAMSNEDVLEDIKKLRHENTPMIVVGNKTDLLKDYQSKFRLNGSAVFISSKGGSNIQQVKDALIGKVSAGEFQQENTVVTNARHHEALLRSRQALDDVLRGLDAKISGELLALDMRRALEALGEITGEVTNDNVLDSIFSRFCIGK